MGSNPVDNTYWPIGTYLDASSKHFTQHRECNLNPCVLHSISRNLFSLTYFWPLFSFFNFYYFCFLSLAFDLSLTTIGWNEWRFVSTITFHEPIYQKVLLGAQLNKTCFEDRINICIAQSGADVINKFQISITTLGWNT